MHGKEPGLKLFKSLRVPIPAKLSVSACLASVRRHTVDTLETRIGPINMWRGSFQDAMAETLTYRENGG